jgi:hypothetical protein
MTLDDRFKQIEANAHSGFIKLRDVRINSNITNRPVDWAYVEQLTCGDVRSLPDLSVMFVPSGNYYECLDGQHRYWATFNSIICSRDDMPPLESYNGDYDRYVKDCLYRIDDNIHARIWPEMSARDVSSIRFWKNRDHGLGASDDDRRVMAKQLKTDNPLMTVAQIAKEIRRSESFVSKALNQTAHTQEKVSDQRYKDADRFCKAIEKAYRGKFFTNEQAIIREEWLKRDPRLRKIFESVAKQMMRDVERAGK